MCFGSGCLVSLSSPASTWSSGSSSSLFLLSGKESARYISVKKSLHLYRFSLLLLRSRCFSPSDLSTCKNVLAHCYLGDWFVLYQLSKNSNTYFFIYLLKHLEKSFVSKVKYIELRYLSVGELLHKILQGTNVTLKKGFLGQMPPWTPKRG